VVVPETEMSSDKFCGRHGGRWPCKLMPYRRGGREGGVSQQLHKVAIRSPASLTNARRVFLNGPNLTSSTATNRQGRNKSER